jgi:hypothetical protein
VPRGEREPLDERRVDAMALDRRIDGAPHVDQRVDVGVGIELTQRVEHLLAAAHAGEPVVDQRDAHPTC